MPRNSATCSIAFCGSQPPDCSWARHRSGMIADTWRPGGYLAICAFAQARFSAVNAKLSGCSSARRRTAMSGRLSVGRRQRRSEQRGYRNRDARRVQSDVALMYEASIDRIAVPAPVVHDDALLRMDDEVMMNSCDREVV